jgi:hypothetical protein
MFRSTFSTLTPVRGSRWAQTFFLQCSGCNHTQRWVRGYTPAPNPYKWDHKDQALSFLEDRQIQAGFKGFCPHAKCEGCGKLHSRWTIVDFQTFIKNKEKRVSEQQAVQASKQAAEVSK